MTDSPARKSSRPSAHLSKSRFMAGLQCPLRLYNDVYRRDLATPYSDTQLAIFDRGTAIGELAQQRYPGGALVGFKPWERAPAIAATRKLLDDPEVPAIYEAALEHQGVFVRVDVLVRNGEGWELVEVKASTRAEKEAFQLDAAIQYWVANGAGLRIDRAGVLVLDRDYVYPGGEFDLQALFRLGDATEFCLEMAGQIDGQVAEFHRMLASDSPPDIPVGEHCFSPYECPYYAECTRGLKFPADPIDQLYRLDARRREALGELGVDSIGDIPADFDLTASQARIRQAVISGQPWQSPELGRALADAQWPLHHLDFEAWQPALPPYPGMRPFQAMPFQFSLHREQADGSLEHREYLHTENSDPRRALAEALLEAMDAAGSIVVYSSYERTMINTLARDLPDLREPLLVLTDRLWDLLPVVRNHYYHPDFRGSYSIKSVLPALVPEAGWTDLDIADGQAAAMAYEQALASNDPAFRETTFNNLKAYCRQDTLAMVELLQALRSVADNPKPH
ncbi:MAG: DUF2779 domain-containing protein [Wenzhouxiangella sp.]